MDRATQRSITKVWSHGLCYTYRTFVLGALLSLCLVACGQPQSLRATVIADGQTRIVRVTGSGVTVRGLLEALELVLGSTDRVEPDLYVTVAEGMTIAVTRVTQTFEAEKLVLPYQHRTMRSEGVRVGERRLLQAGSNGQMEITFRVTLENGAPVSREEVSREVLVEPVDEMVLVGVQGELASVPVSGTIAYMSGDNAWLIREESGLRRNVTGSSDLDGRVFALSDDGSWLVFTRVVAGGDQDPLNSLWLARTSLVGEEPGSLGVTGVIWADWSPDGTRIAYSTAERSGGVPGWKANNDLWLLAMTGDGSGDDREITNVLPATAEIPYAWWGRAFEWGPAGDVLAYAQADHVGVVHLRDSSISTIASFPEYRTHSSWAWVPGVSWSADGALLAYVAHESDQESQSPVDSPSFGLWASSMGGRLKVRLVEEVGMWSAPRWAPVANGPVAFGQAQSPRNSQDSRYEIVLVDRDGSNRRHLYPDDGQLGLIAPDLAWSPDGSALLFVDQGNLYLVHASTADVVQLTSDGQASHPRWAK